MRDHASRGNHAERKKEEASPECRGEYFLDKAICRLASAPLAKFGKVHRLVGGSGPLGQNINCICWFILIGIGIQLESK